MIDNITYKEDYLVKSADVDAFHNMKLSSLMKILQNLAYDGAAILGAGKDKTFERGYLWVFSKLEIQIERFPYDQEIVKLSTFPNELMHFVYPRTFLIKDNQDNLLVKATSFWCLINSNTRKIALPSETGIGATSDIKADAISKIVTKDVSLKESRVVRYTDIDLNKHLNNTRYLDFICDLYDIDYFKNHEIKRLDIAFHHEVKEKEVVDIYASIDNTYFVFKVNDTKVFECNIEYK